MDSLTDHNESPEPFRIRARNMGADIRNALLGRVYWVAAITALAVAAGFYYLSIAPRVYQSTATVQVKISTKGVIISKEEGPQDRELDLRNMDAINTIVGKFKMVSLYQAMLVQNPDLLRDPELLPRQLVWTPPWLRSEDSGTAAPGTAALQAAPPSAIPAGAPSPAVAKGPGGPDESPAAGVNVTEAAVTDPAILVQKAALAREAATRAPDLAKCFEITGRRQTRLVDITVSHTSPAMARRLANALVAAYEKVYVDRRSDRTDVTLKTLQSESDKAQEQLGEAQNALAAYRTALTLVAKLQEEEANLSALLLRYRNKHPDVIQSRQLLKETQEAFMREFTAARESPADAKYWKSMPPTGQGADPEETVRQAIRLLQARSKVLESEIDNRDQTYKILLTQKTGADVALEDKEADFIPLEDAREGKLAKPNPPLIYAAATLGGLMLGAGLALLLHRLDNRVHTVIDLEELAGIPVLASVAALRPEVLKQSAGPAGHDNLMKAWAPDLFFRDNGAKTIEAEMVRVLRTSIILLGPQESLKTILFTSALPGEGKSFISANVAAAFAMQGARTLILDLDLRRPRQHALFGIGRQKGAGVVDVLAGQCPLPNAIHPTGLPNLFLLPAGSPAPNPAELLNVDRLKQLLTALKTGFDRIIIDTAPLLPVSDTRLISRAVDTCILVAGAEKTPKGAILRALELLGASPGGDVRTTIGGCVLNGTVETRRNLGYNYSYGYYGKYGGKYSSYGGVYGEEEDDEKRPDKSQGKRRTRSKQPEPASDRSPAPSRSDRDEHTDLARENPGNGNRP